MAKTLLIARAETNRARYHWLSDRELSYNVETVSSGLDCLHSLRRELPDVLVLEQNLPWGGGDGVLARLREEGLASLIPVVLIGGDEIESCGEFLGAPVVSYLHHSFHKSEMRRCIEEASFPGHPLGLKRAERLREPVLHPLGG